MHRAAPEPAEPPPTAEELRRAFDEHRTRSLAKDEYTATPHDNFMALALVVRDRMFERWIKTQQGYHKRNAKRVYYLSMEFLLGKTLKSAILSLGIEPQVREALSPFGLTLEDLIPLEYDAGLGNGGLGRLAACYLDSMATLGLPAVGYGILFDYGIFYQKTVDGWQVEIPDEWMRLGIPWAIHRPEYTIRVRFGGRTERRHRKDGGFTVEWVDTKDVLATASDVPVPGYGNGVVNTLRLWTAKGTAEFNLEFFQTGDYARAYEEKVASENISKVLYPNDGVWAGLELRLKQEYFFTAASLSDILRRFKVKNKDLRDLPKKAAVQLNDTHPSLAIAELMRILVDEEGLPWETAWEVTTGVFAYTNHTVMPEALETWPVTLLEALLPRHLEIVYEVNARFLREVSMRRPFDLERQRRLSLIQEGPERRVRMAHLCVVGSRSVNGVSALHSDLLKTRLFADFHELWPERFRNVTNGITPRRWLLEANPRLAALVTAAVGEGWVTDLKRLEGLVPASGDAAFRHDWRRVKHENKRDLADLIKKRHDVTIDPRSLFDVQVKRIHEYKRQLLFALYLIHKYLRLKADPQGEHVPRTAIFGGKAAPGYRMAKLIIKFISSVAAVVNADASLKGRLKVIFVWDYRVSLSQRIVPAGDLSEQISTAGTEASGTGCMKLMMNGALTMGTWDGANVEIVRETGPEHAFLFGLKAEEAAALSAGGYDPRERVRKSPALKEVLDLVAEGFFSPEEPGLFKPLLDALLGGDRWLVLADFDDYVSAQEEAERRWRDAEGWTRSSIVNTAKSGRFSSDRAVAEYNRDIWGA